MKSLCLFCCHGQSGHTVLAAILDAHPKIALAEESHFAKKIFFKNRTLESLIEGVKASSNQQARKAKEPNVKYSYGSNRYTFGRITPYQGFQNTTEVIGDKTGWDIPSLCFEHNKPNCMSKIQRKSELPVKVIHLVRNPFDVIASWHLGSIESRKKSDQTIEQCIDRFGMYANAMQTVLYNYDYKDKILVSNESLIAHPESTINRLCDYLEVERNEELVNNASKILFKSPRKKSDRVKWTTDQTLTIKQLIRTYPFLREYSNLP